MKYQRAFVQITYQGLNQTMLIISFNTLFLAMDCSLEEMRTNGLREPHPEPLVMAQTAHYGGFLL